MYSKLLVPLDGSPFAEHALPLALSIAQHAGASLQVALVHGLVPRFGDGRLASRLSLDGTMREQQSAYLGGVLRRLTAVAPVEVTSALLEGPVAGALREHAVSTGTDLVIMATHGRGPLSRVWLGSVADKSRR